MMGNSGATGCAEVRECLSAYLDEEVTRAERSLVERHLAACESCRERFTEIERLVGVVSSLPKVEVGPEFLIALKKRMEAPKERDWLRSISLDWDALGRQLPWVGKGLTLLERIAYLVARAPKVARFSFAATLVVGVVALSPYARTPSSRPMFRSYSDMDERVADAPLPVPRSSWVDQKAKIDPHLASERPRTQVAVVAEPSAGMRLRSGPENELSDKKRATSKGASASDSPPVAVPPRTDRPLAPAYGVPVSIAPAQSPLTGPPSSGVRHGRNDRPPSSLLPLSSKTEGKLDRQPPVEAKMDQKTAPSAEDFSLDEVPSPSSAAGGSSSPVMGVAVSRQAIFRAGGSGPNEDPASVGATVSQGARRPRGALSSLARVPEIRSTQLNAGGSAASGPLEARVDWTAGDRPAGEKETAPRSSEAEGMDSGKGLADRGMRSPPESAIQKSDGRSATKPDFEVSFGRLRSILPREVALLRGAAAENQAIRTVSGADLQVHVSEASGFVTELLQLVHDVPGFVPRRVLILTAPALEIHLLYEGRQEDYAVAVRQFREGVNGLGSVTAVASDVTLRPEARVVRVRIPLTRPVSR